MICVFGGQVGRTSLAGSVKEADVLHGGVDRNAGPVLMGGCVQAVPFASVVVLVLARSHDANICPAIVERLVVDMINLPPVAVFKAQKASVHLLLRPRPAGQSDTPDGVVAARIAVPLGMPFELRQFLEVIVIDQGKLPLRQRYPLHVEVLSKTENGPGC